ncbi:ISAzo13-like element transposase-related protein [Thiolapillus sp.]|uniref:ISAzo13-like element transposase-related protein n=1 Tax=Thiolapillus sp. TaxID=2017437 RepID=UPI003AF82574
MLHPAHFLANWAVRIFCIYGSTTAGQGHGEKSVAVLYSKYNPVERLWGVLENHWRGELLDSVEKTLDLARSMAYKGIHPVVRKVKKSYKAGVSLSKQAMRELEKRFDRKPDLESGFVTINPITKLG